MIRGQVMKQEELLLRTDLNWTQNERENSELYEPSPVLLWSLLSSRKIIEPDEKQNKVFPVLHTQYLYFRKS